MNRYTKFCLGLVTLALLIAPGSINARARALESSQQDGEVPSDAEQLMFTKGQNLYLQSRYEPAAGVLKEFLRLYPHSIITDLTLLWLGRSYMQLGKFQEAEMVAKRLRSIKDTPFADIYEGELQTARREGSSRSSSAVATLDVPVSSARIPNGVSPRSSGADRSNSKQTAIASNNSIGSDARSTGAGRVKGDDAAAGTGSSIKPAAQLVSILPSNSKSRQNERLHPERSVAKRDNPSGGTGQPLRPSTVSPHPITLTSGKGAPTATNVSTLSGSSSSAGGAPNGSGTIVSTRPVETEPAGIRPPQGGGLNIVVKQVPNLILALRRASEAASPGQNVQLPLSITNTGNKEDQFSIQTDLPAEFQPTFSLAQGGADTGLPILVTPQLPRGASVEVLLNLRVPDAASDGLQRRFFVRAASQSDYQVIKVADGAINVVAAALSASSEISQNSVMPGESFTQTISVKNAGSAPAHSSRADFVFNPQFELVNANPAPLVYDRPSRTAIWSLGELSAREARDIRVTLRAIPDALALTSVLGRGTMRTQSLPTGTNFESPSITVGKVPKARIDSVSVGLTATPGDTIYVPFVVRNPGNTADSYELRITAPGAPVGTIYADINGDGQHQEGEPAVSQTAQLAPQGGQYPMLLRVQVPSNTPDRQQFLYNIVARSLTSSRVASEASTAITVATPRVRVRAEQVGDNPAPGDTIFYRLVLVNEGSGLAKNLIVSEMLPDALQFVNSEPALNPQDAPGANQRFTWRVSELAPGDTAVLRIAVQLKANLPADVNLISRHTLSYQDVNGNGYQGQ